MKYIGTTCFLCGEICNIIIEKLNDKYNYHRQFRIVCKARGIKHANELTSWVAHNAFKHDYCAETANETELSFFEKDSSVNFIIGSSSGKYITDIELKALLQTHSTKKGGELSDCAIMNDRLFKAGQLVRHFKGGIYRILAPVALHTDDYTAFVVYEEESFNDGGVKNGKVWVRPLAEFCSEVDREKYPDVKQKYRFELLAE